MIGPGSVIEWSAAAAALAGGVTAVGFLVKRGVAGFRLVARAARAVTRLAAIGDEESWPNGSTNLPSFLDGLHSAVSETRSFMAEHSARHIDIEAELERHIPGFIDHLATDDEDPEAWLAAEHPPIGGTD